MRRGPAAARRSRALDTSVLRALRRRPRTRGDYAGRRAPPDLRAMRPAVEVRLTDLPFLSESRAITNYVIRRATGRAGLPRLRVRRLPSLSEGVRRAPRLTAGHADRGWRRDAAARCGRDTEGVY